MSSKDVESRVIKLTVYEVDRLKRHVVIGHALCPLRDYWDATGVTSSDEKAAIETALTRTNLVWRDLQREVTEVRTTLLSTVSYIVYSRYSIYFYR